MSASKRLLVIPRWGGTSTSDFYPWLFATLRSELLEAFAEARALDLPHPEQPDVQTWPSAILHALGSDPAALAQTVVIAHSVGCQALLRALGMLPEGAHLQGALLVAGWWESDKPWDSIRPWLAPIANLERVRAAAGKLRVLISDNDPFTADHARNWQLWEERLGAQVMLSPAARHFNASEEPAVLEALRQLVAEG